MTTVRVTEKQRQAVEFVRYFVALNGRPPKMREIGAVMGFSSSRACQLVSTLKLIGVMVNGPRVVDGVQVEYKKLYCDKFIGERTAIGAMIFNARRTAGMTQEALAEKACCQSNQIWIWETGRAEPRLSTLRLLAEKMGCTLTLEFKATK